MSQVTIESHIGEVKAELRNRVPAIMSAVAIEAEGNAIDEINKIVYSTPESPDYKRTGRLKNSISHASDADSAYIGTNVEYAPYVELGARNMKPRPFLKNAIANYREDYKRIMEDGLK